MPIKMQIIVLNCHASYSKFFIWKLNLMHGSVVFRLVEHLTHRPQSTHTWLKPNLTYWTMLVSWNKQHQFRVARHSSVDPLAPTIKGPWVQIPSTTSTLFSIWNWIVIDKDENKQKDSGIGRFLKKNISFIKVFERRLS